ncbi:MAG: hypothetical protein IKK11_06420 [Oscillospiraceae bacterium]|nr:hypothetical protein [Oscillospiraceae bacterium]
MQKTVSPCEKCTRVSNPDKCENKLCKEWKAWFLRQWAGIYQYGQKANGGKEI